MRIFRILEQALTGAPPSSVLDLQGQGKVVWAGVTSDESLRTLRQAWDS